MTSVTGNSVRPSTRVATEPIRTPRTAPGATGTHDDLFAGVFDGVAGNGFGNQPDQNGGRAGNPRLVKQRARRLEGIATARLLHGLDLVPRHVAKQL